MNTEERENGHTWFHRKRHRIEDRLDPMARLFLDEMAEIEQAMYEELCRLQTRTIIKEQQTRTPEQASNNHNGN